MRPKAVFCLIFVLSNLLAMPPRLGFSGAMPVFPPGVEVAGPNRLKDCQFCETVTILVQFPDNLADTLRHSPARFDSTLYSVGVYNGQPYRAGSLNDYFLENSYGTYRVKGGVAGNRWFISSYNYSRYYDDNYMLYTGEQMAKENLQQVDSLINFQEFDLDGDGHIPALFMVHAGADGADNGNVNCCWSHAIPYFNYTTDDGVTIDGVTNVPEFAMVTESRDTTLCCIAVMCHELGHLVGLPDLYDGSRYTWGIGYWGLMGYGAWGAGGNTPWSPSHMEAWSKVEAGFVTPVVITHDTFNLKIFDVETHPVVYKVWRNGVNGDTCFYLENRQKKGFDAPLPGSGLLIWHIDPGAGAMHSSKARNNQPTYVAVRNIQERGDTIICNITLDTSQTGVEEDRYSLSADRSPPRMYPNPFYSQTEIRLGTTEPLEIGIFSSNGRLIKKEAGPGRLAWNGTDDYGRLMPAGVYLIMVRDREFSFTEKVLFLR